MAEPDQVSSTEDRSTVVRGAVAAVATSAAAYGVQRWLASQHDRAASAQTDEPVDGDDEGNDEQADGDEGHGEEHGWSDRRDELTETLTSKAAEAKKAAAKLRPGRKSRSSSAERARESASPHLVRIAKEAASTLGATAAERAPDVIRNELLPSFIEGFEKAK